jgi:hypothetical protein
MPIDGNKTIIDYIVDQADRYDVGNLKFESDILGKLKDLHSNMRDRILQNIDIHGDINTVARYQTLVNRIQVIIEQYYSDAYKILTPAVGTYVETGYNHMADLIDIGLEIQDKAKTEQVSEIAGKKNIPDTSAIEFMRNHAFEQVKNISNDLLNQLKAQLSMMVIQGKTDKGSVRDAVEKIMNTSGSRADMIAQTELSMAYNNGAVERFNEFNTYSADKMLKYWHGFKYSITTCTYCRPRIGLVFDVGDNSEVLPAHPRCRCVWLPYMDGWDKPISTMFTRGTNMINRVYSTEQIYDRLNKRLGISYANYIPPESASAYLSGDRSDEFFAKLAQARDMSIKNTMSAFDIASAKSDEKMAHEFNIQMPFWKKYVSQSIVDNDVDDMKKAYTAIKGIMILPWTGGQLTKWSKLLKQLDSHIK